MKKKSSHHRVQWRIDFFSYFCTRTPGIPVIDLVGVFGVFEFGFGIHVNNGHHFSDLIRLIGTGTVEDPSGMETHFSQVKSFNDMLEIIDSEIFFDLCFGLVAYCQIPTEYNLMAFG